MGADVSAIRNQLEAEREQESACPQLLVDALLEISQEGQKKGA